MKDDDEELRLVKGKSKTLREKRKNLTIPNGKSGYLSQISSVDFFLEIVVHVLNFLVFVFWPIYQVQVTRAEYFVELDYACILSDQNIQRGFKNLIKNLTPFRNV